MFKKLTLNFCSLFIATASLAQFSGGDGSVSNPYQISNLTDLQTLSENSSYWYDYFVQTADIDASPTVNWNSGLGFEPIGKSSESFKGEYNGKEHKIYGLFIDRPTQESIGFFGLVSGKVDSLGIVNCDIKGKNYVGGVVGYNGNNSVVTNCFVTGSISGNAYVGGLIGRNFYHSYVNKSNFSGSVNGTSSFVGGLIGDNYYYCNVYDSYATGIVNGMTNKVGGLVGHNFDHSGIIRSFAICSTSGASYVGGLVGECNGIAEIRNSFSEGNINGSGNVIGGLLGYNNNSKVIDSYSTVSVNGNSYLGGLVGLQAVSSIENSYSVGSVSGTGNIIGGLVGHDSLSNVIDSFWDVQASGITVSSGGIGKSTTEMQLQNTFTDASWSFVGITLNGIWKMGSCSGISPYPLLYWQSNVLSIISEFSATISTTISGMQYQWIDCTDNTEILGATSQNFTAEANGSYAVIVSNGGCSDTSTCVTINSVGISENQLVNLNIYPNPATETITISSTLPIQLIELYDIKGELVLTKDDKYDTINLSSIENGVYFMKLFSEAGIVVKRIEKI